MTGKEMQVCQTFCTVKEEKKVLDKALSLCYHTITTKQNAPVLPFSFAKRAILNFA